ncbi:D-alanyl-D-alanine carboxypeptidase [Brevibacillus agri]|uniref:D-alanyl-D-alanine carboxypeptidase n=1 Tax=Brevibacillus gelatini TaxID=1655277 RepID=A0A3M8AWB1_9BACL|nr:MULTISPECIES: D-alanyl-D-alanine carboxypeptidase family protein [Brevibacillus]MED4569051.1 D-alanyl-D-alanine carboxypeptidase [Brevibacillus agri]RNB55303.1 D-alanyl-D-alanine carboxypeptidase [Brevibacillus gelatini]WHX30558.1 D-alanyl-D-alanine carboxypeptidase family protein [Brevibacillus agri]
MRRGTLLLLLLVVAAGYACWSDMRPAVADLVNRRAETVLGKITGSVEARAAVLLDSETGEVLYAQNADTPYPVASMSKMMTEYLLLEAIREKRVAWDDEVPVSANAAGAGGARVQLEPGRAYPLRDLYEAMAVGSANNAAVAIGEYLAGSTSAFARQMNKKAAELGLASSSFVNATGLDYDYGQNEMSARDVGMLAHYLLRDFPEIVELTAEPFVQLSFGERVDNTNLMVRTDHDEMNVPGLDGLKTGFTDKAGYCFTGTARQGDKRLISVVMGAANEVVRFTETKKLLERGFDIAYSAEKR